MEGLRAGLLTTAACAGKVIRAYCPARPGAEDPYCRSQLLLCSDVEAQILAVVGPVGGASGAGQAPLPSSSKVGGGNFGSGASSLLSSVLKPMRTAFGVGKGTASAAAGGAPGEGEEGALSQIVRLQLEAAFPPNPVITPSHLAPITDLVVLHGDEAPPPGYARLTHSVTGLYAGDLNAASGTKQLWLAVSRAPEVAAPITALLLVAVDKGEFLPPGFSPVRRFVRGQFGRAANLRYGMSSSSAAAAAATAAAAAAAAAVGSGGSAGDGSRHPGGASGGSGPGVALAKGGAAAPSASSAASGEADLLLCISRSLGAPIIDVGIVFPTGALALTNIGAAMLPSALRPAQKSQGLTLAPERPPLPGGPWGTLATMAAASSASQGEHQQLASEEASMASSFNAAAHTLEASASAFFQEGLKQLGPTRESIPPGYTLLARTVLGSGGMLSGGSARGAAALCFAKDCTHVDALGDAGDVVEELHERMVVRAEAAAAAASAAAAAAAGAAAAAAAAAAAVAASPSASEEEGEAARQPSPLPAGAPRVSSSGGGGSASPPVSASKCVSRDAVIAALNDLVADAQCSPLFPLQLVLERAAANRLRKQRLLGAAAQAGEAAQREEAAAAVAAAEAAASAVAAAAAVEKQAAAQQKKGFVGAVVGLFRPFSKAKQTTSATTAPTSSATAATPSPNFSASLSPAAAAGDEDREEVSSQGGGGEEEGGAGAPITSSSLPSSSLPPPRYPVTSGRGGRRGAVAGVSRSGMAGAAKKYPGGSGGGKGGPEEQRESSFGGGGGGGGGSERRPHRSRAQSAAECDGILSSGLGASVSVSGAAGQHLGFGGGGGGGWGG